MNIRQEHGFATVLVVLLIGLIVAAGFSAVQMYQSHSGKTAHTPLDPGKGDGDIATATPKSGAVIPSGWKTYTADSYSVGYPDSWNALPPIVATQSKDTVAFSNRTDYTSTDSGAVYVLTDSRAGTDIETCYKQSSYATGYSVKSGPAKLGGAAATRYIFDPTTGKPRYAVVYFVAQAGRCYSLTLATTSQSSRDASLPLAGAFTQSFSFK